MNIFSENPKPEILNSKQIRITKIQNPKQKRQLTYLHETEFARRCFEHLSLGFGYYLVFRNSNFEFAERRG